MQAIRTIFWVLMAIVFVSFVAINWETVPVNIWPITGGNYLHFEWPVGFVALISLLLGFAPMWLLNRARVWHLNRRIASLENSLRAATAVAPVEIPEVVATIEPAQPVSEVSNHNDVP